MFLKTIAWPQGNKKNILVRIEETYKNAQNVAFGVLQTRFVVDFGSFKLFN